MAGIDMQPEQIDNIVRTNKEAGSMFDAVEIGLDPAKSIDPMFNDTMRSLETICEPAGFPWNIEELRTSNNDTKKIADETVEEIRGDVRALIMQLDNATTQIDGWRKQTEGVSDWDAAGISSITVDTSTNTFASPVDRSQVNVTDTNKEYTPDAKGVSLNR